ncbi:MAG: hypothetical protein WBH03_20365, partial [Cyclobacteriaceae bacterium]
MTTIKTIKDFLHDVAKDGGILETDGNHYIVFDARLESSDKVSNLYYLALLVLHRNYDSPFDPQLQILKLSHLDHDTDKHMLYLERDKGTLFDTLSGIIEWQDQKRFDNWLKKIETDEAALEQVTQLKQKCLVRI